jgi:outer membrane lipoprotein-sorting protein
MKRLLLLAVCLAVGAATAQAQPVPLSLESYDEKTDKLTGREWYSAEGHSRMETPDGFVTVYRADSMKFFLLDPKARTIMEIPRSQLKPGQIAGIKAYDVTGEVREFIGIENVEGYECRHYRTKTTNVNAHGIEGEFVNDEWIYEPLKLAIRQSNGNGAVITISRNIRQGPQPASLFVIPRDYKRVDASAARSEVERANEMLKMLGGQGTGGAAQTEQQRKMQEAMQRVQDALGGKK